MLRAWLLTAAVTLAVPAGAVAGTVTKSGGTIVYAPSAGAAVDSPLVVQDAPAVPNNYIVENATAGSGCVAYADTFRTGASCPAGGVSSIQVSLGDGDDSAAGRDNRTFLCGFLSFPACPPAVFAVSIPLTMDGGAGNDAITDGNATDSLTGGAGGDTLASFLGADTQHGGADRDSLTGGPGSEQLFGDEGRDTIVGGGGADDIHGGDGDDQATYAGVTQAVNVSLDDVANDGRPDISENDNVRSDVEGVQGGSGADTLNGNSADNVLAGGPGQDTLDGRAGFDAFFGEAGGANVLAHDGNAERVDCGDGSNDLAVTDDFDQTSGCETNQHDAALQGDQDRDGVASPADCNDGDAAIHPGAAETPGNGVDEDCSGADAGIDADADGSAPPADCDDGNAAVHPGAAEVFGNAIDEDCSGKADPLGTTKAFLRTDFLPGKKSTTVKELTVRDASAGTTIVMSCLGGKKKGCALDSTTTTLVKETASYDVRKALKLKKLNAGAKLQISLSRPGTIGVVHSLAFKKGKLPTRTTVCQLPGSSATVACP